MNEHVALDFGLGYAKVSTRWKIQNFTDYETQIDSGIGMSIGLIISL